MQRNTALALGGVTTAAVLAGAYYYYYHQNQNKGKKIDMKTEEKKHRLPQSVIPSHYDLTLRVDLQNHKFSGEEVIDIGVKESTNKIILNTAELKIIRVEFTQDSKVIQPKEINTDEENEISSFIFENDLPIGTGKLKILFQGILNDKMKGFYRSTYKHYSGEERVMAVTQFEPADARRAFPCWDEPAFKASFKLSLCVPKDRTAISNMPIVDEIEKYDMKTVIFDKTPIMSTYLLAFVVGEFDHVQDTTPNGILVRVFTPLGKSEQGKFALEVAVKTLPFYEEYFGIKYPLPKADLIAIPDFAAGAMENWGLITYRETALLVDPKSSSASNKQWVALVVGHELAHQWFGNLVTMEWWTHLWLNEGFASYTEYVAVAYCFPEWDIWTQFVYQDFGQAQSLDALESSHPVEVDVETVAEIDEIFDNISYSKGCSIIRMLANYLGEEQYKKGVNIYLNKHRYGNATTEDLWEGLEIASEKPVRKIMQDWTKKTGYPVLTVEETSQDGKRAFKVSQARFLATGPSKSETLWQVPINFVTQKNQKFKHLLTQKEEIIKFSELGKDEWIKFNQDQTGFFRVKYSSHLLSQLRGAIENLELSAADRLGIQNDAFALSRAGLLATVEALDILSSFQNEVEYAVWADLSSNLAQLDVILSFTDYYSKFQAFCLKLYSKIGEKLGWDAKSNESHLDSLTRSLVLSRLGKYGDENTIAEAKKRFNEYLKDPDSLSPDLRGVVYSIVIANGNEQTFEELLDLYRKAELHEEKERVMRSLGNVQDEQLLKKTLDFSISKEVRSQDTVFVINTVANNRFGRELAWKFVQQNWELLYERFHGFLLARLVKSTCSNFAQESKAKEIEDFFKQHPAPGTERSLQQALENIHSNAKWLQRDQEAMRTYFTTSTSH